MRSSCHHVPPFPFSIQASDLSDNESVANILQQQRILKRAKTVRLPQKEAMNITKNLGMLLLAIYLILVGITLLVHIAIPVLVTGVLALAAGILILIGK
jgi:uncharacterized membrane protein